MQTGIYGLTLWVPTLFTQVLSVSPKEAARLMIFVSLGGFVGRIAFSYLSDAIGRRRSGMLIGCGGALLTALAGYFHDASIGTVSVFFLLVVAQRFFGDGSYAIIGPYLAEVWPARLRASGMGLDYGLGNLGKILGPLGLALVVGSSNYVNPQATVDAIFPAFLYLAFWYALAACAFWLIAAETKGRSIEEIDKALTEREPTTLLAA
jgi:MFS transporter, putative metabolite:H+ symporter